MNRENKMSQAPVNEKLTEKEVNIGYEWDTTTTIWSW